MKFLLLEVAVYKSLRTISKYSPVPIIYPFHIVSIKRIMENTGEYVSSGVKEHCGNSA